MNVIRPLCQCVYALFSLNILTCLSDNSCTGVTNGVVVSVSYTSLLGVYSSCCKNGFKRALSLCKAKKANYCVVFLPSNSSLICHLKPTLILRSFIPMCTHITGICKKYINDLQIINHRGTT